MASRVKGVGEIRRRLRKLPASVKAPVQQVFTEEAPAFEADLKVRAPRHKGRLASAARAILSRDKLGFYAGYSKARAGFKREWKRGGFVSLWQEFGTKLMGAQSFIKPTYNSRKARILARIKTTVVRALQQSGRG